MVALAPARPLALALTPVQRFGRCEPIVVHLEGAYVNNPKDPGGATNMGVTLRAFEAHRGDACTWQDVKALTPAEVRDIYCETYRPAVCCDQLPSGVDLIVFDTGVSCGRGRAATFLQIGLGETPDGAIGPKTPRRGRRFQRPRRPCRAHPPGPRHHSRGLFTFPTFGLGWLNRLATVALAARAWGS